MRTRRKTLVAVGAAALMVGMAACSGGGGGADDGTTAAEGSIETMDSVTFKVSESGSPTGASAKALTAWTEAVTEQTGGKIKFELYFASSLLGQGETLDGVETGIGDIVQVTTQAFPEKLPATSWLTRASSALNAGFPVTSIQGTLSSTDFAKSNEVIQAEFSGHNAIVLRSGSSNYVPAICTKPVETLDQAKGLRIGATGEANAAEARALGMEPVAIPSQEMFEALQRGVVDCMTASDGGYVFTTFGFTEVAKYVTPLRFSPITFIGILMNKDSWQSLPADAQKIMLESWAIYERVRLEETLLDFGRFLEDVEAQGVEILDPTELNEKLAEFQEQYRKDLIDDAPSSVEDPESLLNDYLDLIEKNQSVVEDALTGEATQPGPAMKEAYGTASSTVDYEKIREIYVDMLGKYVE